jgi:hypothetical protein
MAQLWLVAVEMFARHIEQSINLLSTISQEDEHIIAISAL